MASLWKQIGRTAKKGARAVTHPGKTVRNASREVRRTVRDPGRTLSVVAPVLDLAASAAPVIPGIGSAVGSGLAVGAALARRDSPEEIALAAAMGAIPGGTVARMAAGGVVGAGKALIKGKKLNAALMMGARGAIDQAPGGALARAAGRAAFNAGGDVVQGKRFDRALKRAAVSVAPAAGGALAGAAAKHLGAGRFIRSMRAPDPFRMFSKAAPKALRLDKISNVLARGVLDQTPGLARLTPSAVAAKTGLTARAVSAARKSGPKLRWKPLSRKAAKLIERLSSIPLSALSRDTAGLAPDGMTYTVERGDYGVKIAQKLVGDGNRWRELKAANPQIARRADPKNYGMVIYPGDVLQLPASWIKSAPTPKPPIVIVPDPIIVKPPVVDPVKPGPIVVVDPPKPLPDPVIPTPDVTDVVVLKSKAILAAWSKTDGLKLAGVTDYGQRAEDVTPSWTSRDRLTLASFMRANGSSDSSGTLTQQAADMLHAWAERKANNVTPKPPVVVVDPTKPTPNKPGPIVVVDPTKPSDPTKPGPIVVVDPNTPNLPTDPTDPTVPPKPKSSGAAPLVALGAAAIAAIAFMV